MSMAAPYSYNSLGRPTKDGSRRPIGSSSSQQNLTGTLNRTQVERRPAQFISAKPRNRLDSNDSFFNDDRSSPGNLKNAKSYDRLTSTSSSGSRSNLAQPNKKPPSPSAGGPRGNHYPHQAPPQQQGNSPNYSNIQTYNNNNYEKENHVHTKDVRDHQHTIRPNSGNTERALVPNTSSTNKYSEFDKIRLECLRQATLYADNVFLPVDASLYFSRHPPYDIEWIRAKDIAHMYRQAPKFFSDGVDRFDVRQGKLGDCWFVAAIACLSNPDYRYLFERVVPPEQSFQDGWYSGVFHFHFWHFGKWKEVIVDDFLPTVRGQLTFVNSSQTNEFWAALMEKAYAKLYGSYESLKSGVMIDALTDLTGGITESYSFHGSGADVPDNIVNILFKALERQSLIGCGIIDKGSGENVLPNGLVEGHAYSVTDLRRILNGRQPVTLIRIRNPHGDAKEWKGRWSEWSQEWQQISPGDKEKLGLICRNDGEFWMDFEDFAENFDTLDICNLTPDSPVSVQRKWFTVDHHGRWMKHYNAGGRPSLSAHWSNPQYFLRLDDTDEDEDNVCSVIVQLLQKDRRKIKQKGQKFLYIGFCVYQYEKGYSIPLKKDYFDSHRDLVSSGCFTNARQVTKRFALPPGEYVVVPCTWDTDEEGDFYIRFFFEKGNVAEFCDEKPEKSDLPQPTPSAEWKEEEEHFKAFFYRHSEEDMEVNAFELRDAINEGLKKDAFHRDISLNACRCFVNLMDVDGSGRLGYNEFQYLWFNLKSWKKLFYQYDINKSGMMEVRELRAAIGGGGYKVSHKTIANLIFQFGDEYGKINLDDFLTLMARLMKCFNSFNGIQKEGSATLTLEQWLDKTLIF